MWQPKRWIEFHILYIICWLVSLLLYLNARETQCENRVRGATIWWTFSRPTVIFLMICAIWRKQIMDHYSTWTWRGFPLCTTVMTARCHPQATIMSRPAGIAAGRNTSPRLRVSERTARASVSCGPVRSARERRLPRIGARLRRSGRGGGLRRSTRPSTRWRGRPWPIPTRGYPRWRFYAAPSAILRGCRSCCRRWTSRRKKKAT